MNNEQKQYEEEGFVSRKGAGNTWNPKADESVDKVLIGWLLGSKSGVGEFQSAVYQIESINGEKYDVWGDAVLDSSDNGLGGLPDGSYVRIEFLGKQLKKNAKVGSKNSKDYFNNWDVAQNKAKDRRPSFNGGTTTDTARGIPSTATVSNTNNAMPEAPSDLPF